MLTFSTPLFAYYYTIYAFFQVKIIPWSWRHKGSHHKYDFIFPARMANPSLFQDPRVAVQASLPPAKHR